MKLTFRQKAIGWMVLIFGAWFLIFALAAVLGWLFPAL